MNSVVERPAVPGSRPAREMAFWNDAYHPQGANNHKYVWVKKVENQAYLYQYFRGLLKPLVGKNILSIGGGLDWIGAELAKVGNRVVSADISPMAAARTLELARQTGAAGNLRAVVANCETMPFSPGRFDVVICKRALHHMDLTRVLPRVRDVLVPGGIFIAEEPVCLHKLFQWFHQKFPFAPEAPRTQDEKELTPPDVDFIRRIFPNVRFRYFDLLARESVAYFLSKAHLLRLLKPLGMLDYLLINRCFPPLRYLSTYVLIQAVK